MELIKRHKGLALVGGLTIVLVVILLIIFSRMIFSTGKTKYGDRLNNIVKINKKVLEDNKKELEELDEVKKVTIRTQGKIIYTIMTVTDKTSKDKAKEIAKNTITKYDEKVIECYDFEFLITQEPILDKDGNDSAYTISGTKHPDNENISWTRN